MIPTARAAARPIPEATRTPWMARAGWPAPRFCPATVAAAPMSPRDVHVISEKRRA